MNRVVAILLVLFLCLGLCACGGSETPQLQNTAKEQETATQQETVKEEELYEKSGTTEDGTTFTTWRRGGPEGTPVKLIYDAPDGTHYEEYYSYEGVLEYCITTGADGSSYEIFFYPSGNMEKSILKNADGSSEELRFLDNGYVDENGITSSGMVYYEKHVSADGHVEERGENTELLEDGTWWRTDELDDGSTMRTHFNQEGYTMESYWDIPYMSKHVVYQYYADEKETLKSMETTYDNSEEYDLTEYYEDGSLKYRHMINFGGLKGTERIEEVSPLGYTTYMLLTHPNSGTQEWFADEMGNLEKHVDKGKVYEGDAITSKIRQDWDNIKNKPDQGEKETEEDADGTYWVTTTYRSGKIVKEHFSREDKLLSTETTDTRGIVEYVECYDNGNIRYLKQTVEENTCEYTYDEEGYEIHYREVNPEMEVELIADETGKLVTVLVNGVERTGVDFKIYSSGHNFRSK